VISSQLYEICPSFCAIAKVVYVSKLGASGTLVSILAVRM
jgi:hypothetical protein